MAGMAAMVDAGMVEETVDVGRLKWPSHHAPPASTAREERMMATTAAANSVDEYGSGVGVGVGAAAVGHEWMGVGSTGLTGGGATGVWG